MCGSSASRSRSSRTRRDLPIPGSPDEQHHLALAVPGLLPSAQQQRDLLARARPAASDRRRAAPRSGLRRDPRPRPARPRSGSAKPLSRCGPRSSSSNTPPSSRRVAWLITTLPGAASAWSRAARFGVSPTTVCSLRRALADQLADHDQAGRDADPRRERHARAAWLEPRHRLDQLEPGAHRPLGVVLVRLRPAEVGEHAIAHVLGDVAAPSAR